MKFDQDTGCLVMEAGEELRCIGGDDLTVIRSTDGRILALCAISEVILMVDRAGHPPREDEEEKPS